MTNLIILKRIPNNESGKNALHFRLEPHRYLPLDNREHQREKLAKVLPEPSGRFFPEKGKLARATNFPPLDFSRTAIQDSAPLLPIARAACEGPVFEREDGYLG